LKALSTIEIYESNLDAKRFLQQESALFFKTNREKIEDMKDLAYSLWNSQSLKSLLITFAEFALHLIKYGQNPENDPASK